MEATRIADGYPRKINEDWEGLPGNLDAALTWTNGNTFFFKENHYWRFKNQKMYSGYPQEISTGFGGIPNNVDAAFLWGGNGKTYFFKGSAYWRYIDPTGPPVNIDYPLPISSWEGVPNNIDAVLEWPNKQTYFFKEKSYYRFDDESSSAIKSDHAGPYSRSTSVWWLGCQEKTSNSEDLTTDSFSGDDMHHTESMEDDNSPTVTQTLMENDPVASSGKSTSLDEDLHKNDGDEMTTPSLQSQELDANSAACFCPSLLLSLVLMAVLKTFKF
ncbi:unnamed protein product [Larinioides sclopetarius]|uniref:Matrix metalloproteinase-16 n=1 Tax=Larinioides sclopetarius TaxID=280406 RepID=A0AAV2BAY8_9ARAC